MPGASGSKWATSPGDSSACSRPAAAGSKDGSNITESGGKVTSRRELPPGPGRIDVAVSVRSRGSGLTSAVVAHTKDEAKPGVCSNSFDHGGSPSCTTTDFPRLSLPVTTRRTVIRNPPLSTPFENPGRQERNVGNQHEHGDAEPDER